MVLLALILTACNVKLNLNSNLNQSTLEVQPNANANKNTNVNENANQNLNLNENANLNQNTNNVPAANLKYEIDATPEKLVTSIKIGETVLNNLKELCGADLMVFAEPKNGYIIFKQFNPGSDKPISGLYKFDLNSKVCKKLNISKELTDFGVLVLSPDLTKLAVALETNEAKEIKLLDLINDTSKSLVMLPEGETLNGGYGGLSNYFNIKWLDDKTIEYTVFADTVKNYDVNAPAELEKVLQERVVKIE